MILIIPAATLDDDDDDDDDSKDRPYKRERMNDQETKKVDIEASQKDEMDEQTS